MAALPRHLSPYLREDGLRVFIPRFDRKGILQCRFRFPKTRLAGESHGEVYERLGVCRIIFDGLAK
jgi:hypothetical protein